MDDSSPPTATTLQDLLTALATRGEIPAVIAFDAEAMRTVSYRALHRRSLALAGGLIARGIRPGTPVALYAPNSAEWIVCRLALIAADALCVPVDFEADGEQLALLLRDSGARTVFAVAGLVERLRAAEAALGEPLDLVLLTVGTGEASGLPSIESIAGTPPDTLPPAAPDAPVAQFYTSGTTGPPKAVPLSHRNILTNTRELLALGVLGGEDRVALPLPLHHSYPFIVGMVLPLLAGATIVLPAGVSGPQLVRALRDGAATVLVGVPRLFEALAAAIDTRLRGLGAIPGPAVRALLSLSTAVRRRLGRRTGRALLAPLHRRIAPRLHTMVCGGAKLDAAVEWRLEALGWRVLTGYGLVETTSVACFNRPGAARVGSAGKPSPAVEMRIVPLEDMEHGEIQFRGPIVFEGYRNNPEANTAAFTSDGWFRTGDLGWCDEDGFLFIAARSKEVIVLPDGKNVAPDAVEAVYARSRLVQEIAVLERKGRLVAIVVPDLEAARAAATGRLRDELRVSLGGAGAALPRYMRIADFVTARQPLPRNRLGKYLRHELPAIYDGAGRNVSGTRAARGTPAPEPPAGPRAAATLRWLKARFPDRDVDPDGSLQMDLDIDSLAWIDLALDLERRFGIALTEDTVAGLVTVRDLLDAVERAPQAAGGGQAAPALPLERTLAEPGPAARLAGAALYGIAWGAARALFRLRVEGRARIPNDGRVVLAANHESDLDPVVLAAAMPYAVLRRTWWGADARRVFGSRLGRAIGSAVHLFPVDDRAPAASIDRAVAILDRGRALIWFPEEWRSPDGTLLPFRPGVGAIVARTRARVVPVHIEGTFEAMPRDARLPRLRRVRIRFGVPLEASALVPDPMPDDAHTAHRAIAARIRDAVAALAEEGD